MCRRPLVRDGAQCRQSRWAEAISRVRPLRGTRDRLSPGWWPEHGVSVRYWAYSSLHELPIYTPRTKGPWPTRHGISDFLKSSGSGPAAAVADEARPYAKCALPRWPSLKRHRLALTLLSDQSRSVSSVNRLRLIRSCETLTSRCETDTFQTSGLDERQKNGTQQEDGTMAACFRYIVNDVDAAIEFYTRHLDFKVEMHPAPGFAEISREDMHIYLTRPSPGVGGGAKMPSGEEQKPGGWNRIHLLVEELDQTVATLTSAGCRFR